MIRACFILFLFPVLSLASQLTARNAFVNRVGPLVDDSVGPMQTVVTDLSTTPSTNTTTLWGVRNAIRIWTGDQDHTLPWFELYVTTNGVAAPTVRLYYGQGRILWVGTNVSVSLGTTNGRSVKVSPMTVAGTLPVPSGKTNTITVAKAGPPIWTPSAAQIVMPVGSNAFTVTATNDFPLFVSEFDGSAWSPPRWYRLEASNAITIHTTYRSVALANYDELGLTVVTPAGSTVNSTGATMHLTFPAITGTSWPCATVDDIHQAIENAVSGDEISIGDGIYALTNNITATNFAANCTGGNWGMEGITLRSSSGNRDAVVLTGSATNTGAWSLLSSNTNSTATAWFKSVTFGLSNGWNNFRCQGGSLACEDVRWTGRSSNAVASATMESTAGSAGRARFLWCQSDTSAEDCYDLSPNAAHTDDSVFELIGCVGHSGGPNIGDQIATTHSGGIMEIWGGWYSNATQNVWSPDASNSPLRVFFGNSSTNGGGASGHDNCRLLGATSRNVSASGGFCEWALFSEDRQYPRNFTCPNVWHNVFPSAGIGAFVDAPGAGNVSFVGNVYCGGHSEAVRIGFDTGSSTNPVTVIGNTLASNTWALNLRSTIPMWVSMTNNACRINANSILLTGVQTNAYGADYNVFDATINTKFNQTNSNTLNADAALDVRFFPTAAGNCDGTGFAAFPWVGDSDPWGYVWVYKSGVWPRGARSRPVIVSGAFIYPDVW